MFVIVTKNLRFLILKSWKNSLHKFEKSTNFIQKNFRIKYQRKNEQIFTCWFKNLDTKKSQKEKNKSHKKKISQKAQKINSYRQNKRKNFELQEKNVEFCDEKYLTNTQTYNTISLSWAKLKKGGKRN